jgi:uncharacterized protein (TIGR03086 family)
MSSGAGGGHHRVTTILDLEPPARRLAAVVDGIRDDQLTAPTPCDIPVAALLDHVVGLTAAFRDCAAKIPSTQPPESSADHLDPQWRTTIPRQLDELAAAWRDPAAWEGTATAGGVTMPAEGIAHVAIDELVLHAWDLARATGQRFEPDAASVEVVHGFTSQTAQQGGVEGLFGPPVDVPADAPLFDRALGFSGRDPSWAPADA